MRTTFLILTVVLAAIFAVSGMAKVLNTRFAQANASHLGISIPLSRTIGIVEVMAVIGLLAGISFKPLTILTAAGIVGLMIGAIGYHLSSKDGIAKVLPAATVGTVAIALVSFAV